MSLVEPSDKNEILNLLEQDPYLNMYSIGDLDERFWPVTDWYGLSSAGRLQSVICIYKGGEIPTLMALIDIKDSCSAENMLELLTSISPRLPDYFFAHLSPGLENYFRKSYSFESSAEHNKMALTGMSLLESAVRGAAVRLHHDDIPALIELYTKSYPGNWFAPDMFDLNRYFGIREGGKIISAAGTHVYSPEYKASALGNITTHPDQRGRGLGAEVTAALSRYLISEGMRVGLNVSKNNESAIACYKKIGFVTCAQYGEFCLRLKRR